MLWRRDSTWLRSNRPSVHASFAILTCSSAHLPNVEQVLLECQMHWGCKPPADPN